MLRLDLHEMLYLYAGAALLLAFIAATLHNLRRTRSERAERRGLLKCRLCACEFREDRPTVLPRCPSCGALTERRRLSRL